MQVLHADVDVELDVVDRNNKPPVWDANVYGPIHIKENVTVGTVVTSVKARFVCYDMTETRHVTCRAVPYSATPIFLFSFSFLCIILSLLIIVSFRFPLMLFFHHTFTVYHLRSPYIPIIASRSFCIFRVSFDRFVSLRLSVYTLISLSVFLRCCLFSHVHDVFWRERKHVWLSTAR